MSNPAAVREKPAALSEKAAVVVFVVGPALGAVYGIYLFLSHGWIEAIDLQMMAAMYFFTAIGVTIGYHRFLTHKGFKTYRPIKITLAILGSMACQGPVLNWVADHRRHHAHTDVEGDPHSPHLSGDGWQGTIKGWWEAHTFWLFRFERSSKRKYTPDLLDDPDITRIDSLFFLWIALSLLVIPFTVGLLDKGSISGAMVTVLWAGVIRVFLVQNVTWSVNSVCHLWGKRKFPVNKWTGESTNNVAVALPSLGEGYHNNHHAIPRAAIHGFFGKQILLDWSGLIILALEKLGLVWDVIKASPQSIERAMNETTQPAIS